MDNVSIGFLVLLIVVSGAIAAMGDWLGRRLGKKRLRFGRLRPKHTAILMTFIAGMVTTVITVASLSLLSRQVRTWLVEGSRLESQLQATREEVESGKQEISSVRGDLRAERKRLAQEKENVRKATEESQRLMAEAESLKKQVGAVVRQLAENKKLLAELQSKSADLARKNGELANSNDVYLKNNEELIKSNNKLLESTETLEDQINDLTSETQSLQKQVEDAKAAREQANKDVSQITSARDKAQRDLTDTNKELARARADVGRIYAAARELDAQNKFARVNPLIYNRGNEMARLAVRSKLSRAEAQSYLDDALGLASKDASQSGAARRFDSRSFVGFKEIEVSETLMLTEEKQAEQAINDIAGKATDQVIVVRALFNAFREEWVPVKIDVYPNPAVYREGDLIAEARVDGTKGIQGVTRQIVEFIGQQLRDQAIKDGMIPAVGRQPELGEISQEELQQVVAEAVAANRTVTMRVHARKDTRASDPLKLDLRLR